MLLQDGNRQSLNGSSKQSSFLQFEQYVLSLSTINNDKNINIIMPGERYLSELLPPFSQNDIAYSKEFKIELNQRFSSPLYCIMLSVFAAVTVLIISNHRRWQTILLVSSVILALLTRMTEFPIRRLVVINPNWYILQYLWPLLWTMVAFYLLWLDQRTKMIRQR